MNAQTFVIKYRRFSVIFTHLILIIAAYALSFYLRFEFSLPREYLELILRTLPLLLAIKMFVFYYFGLFSGVWRYVSMNDLWQILKAVSLSTAFFILGIVFFYGIQGFPRSVFILDWMLCVGMVTGTRFFSRLFRERYKSTAEHRKKRTLIIGAGEAGIMVLKECRNNPNMNSDVVGFIDDDLAKRHLRIQNVKVLGDTREIPDIIKNNEIEEIIIAIPSAKGEVIRDLIACCKVPNIKLKIVPGLAKIISGELKISLREVRPEDLLGRETVSIDECEIAKYLRDKKVLITGAAGSIGSELCRQVALRFHPAGLILIDHNENNLYFLTLELKSKFKKLNIKSIIGDINDIGLLKKVFSEYKPQAVFHAAAYKHVPLMEENQIAAVKNNVLGSRNMIYAAHHYKVDRFVLVSTDKAVNPVNIMGLSKRLAEIFLQAKARRSKTKFMAVRFGNVLGSDGSVVPLFKKQIEAGGPITITHPDTARYFMSIKEAVLLVLQAGAIGVGGEIFILDMGEQIKILDLARDLVSLSGLELGKDIGLEYIGLRPGEKIREEMLLDKEKDKVTKHNKIYISQADELDVVTLRKQMKELEGYVNSTDKEKVVKKMKEIVRKSHAE